jgi:PKD repeat protein
VVDPIGVTPSFAVSSNSQCLTNNSFDFSNSSNTSVGALTYQWLFGNGVNSTATSPTYVYTNAGTYIVKLIATNNIGCSDSITQQVVVNPMPAAGYTINSNAQCLTGNSFSFTNNSVITTGSLTQHSWSFGDGSSATTLNASRSYAAPGTYYAAGCCKSDASSRVYY